MPLFNIRIIGVLISVVTDTLQEKRQLQQQLKQQVTILKFSCVLRDLLVYMQETELIQTKDRKLARAQEQLKQKVHIVSSLHSYKIIVCYVCGVSMGQGQGANSAPRAGM